MCDVVFIRRLYCFLADCNFFLRGLPYDLGFRPFYHWALGFNYWALGRFIPCPISLAPESKV